jgi:hypothetical protein
MPISRIKTDGIQDDAITSAKIGDTNIQSADIADGSVTTAKIADSSVTTAKIAASAVTSAKLDTNIDVAGTLDVGGAFTSQGIDDNATGNAITIITAGDIGIGNTDPQNIVGAHGGGLVLRSNAARAESTTLFGIRDSSGNLSLQHLHNGTTVFNTGTTGAKTEIVRIDGSGIKFNGDTAATNALDDYEEGTWTPTASASSGTAPSFESSSGTYTKVGRLVTINATITNITAGGTSNAQVQVAGLPFTPDVQDGVGACNFNQVTISNATGITALANAGQDRIIFMMDRTGLARTGVDNQHIDSGVSDAFFTISYITNQ